MSQEHLDRGQILDMMNGYMASCVLGAASELDLFSVLGEESMSADQLTGRLSADLRAMRILLDAVAALGLLDKQDDLYSVPSQIRPFLTDAGPESVLPMIRHRMNILRHWAQLAWVAKAGIPCPRQVSIRGSAADRAAFIGAMHTVSAPVADDLVAETGPPPFSHLLDVGGASGTWTLAFLGAVTDSKATVFDLPDAIEQARARFAASRFADRVTLASGDFYVDDLPRGADFAWISAIVHQHSREDSRELFAKVEAALEPGGWIAVRDVLMEPSRIRPLDGAMFAVNMLVNTTSGGTFTFEEIAEDLQAAGFVAPELRVKSQWMNSVIMARKP